MKFLAIGEMPSHNHSASMNTAGNHRHGLPTTSEYKNDGSGYDDGGGYNPNYTKCYSTYEGNHIHTLTINSVGNSQAHNNLQPYLSIYIWKRIN